MPQPPKKSNSKGKSGLSIKEPKISIYGWTVDPRRITMDMRVK